MAKKLRIRYDSINNPKLHDAPLKFVFLSDLHGSVFGEENAELLHAIRVENPDFILIGGDMFIRTCPESYGIAQQLLLTLAAEYPILYAGGNHEYKKYLYREKRYALYERKLASAGVRFLHNSSAVYQKNGTKIQIHGLELPLDCFRKPFPIRFGTEDVETLIGKPDPSAFHILLAHNPYYGDAYFSWGADLILSGHYHGGMVRFTDNIGAVSSFGHPFPRYCCGKFTKGTQSMLVSAGLGEHSIPIRIHNPRELLVVTCK